MRRLIGWELKKLAARPVFWGFWLLCLALDLLLALDGTDAQRREYLGTVRDSYALTDGRMGPAYDQALACWPDMPPLARLRRETRGAQNTLTDQTGPGLGQFYISLYQIEGPGRLLLEQKYQAFEGAVRRLDEKQAALSLAAAGQTNELWGALFQRLGRALTGQGALWGVLLALYAAGSEELSRTTALVYSTRTGRQVQKAKAAAGLLAALAGYLAWVALAVGAFALRWGLGPLWGASVSSQFHSLEVALYTLPFLTWAPFTWAGYLAAATALGALLTAAFHGLGLAAGLLARDAYKGFLGFFGAAAVNFSATFWAADRGWWLVCQLLAFTPLPLWWAQPLWFTDGGPTAPLPWQECASALFCLLLAGGLWAAAWRYTKRKDVC